jgi:hypothetical protein
VRERRVRLRERLSGQLRAQADCRCVCPTDGFELVNGNCFGVGGNSGNDCPRYFVSGACFTCVGSVEGSASWLCANVTNRACTTNADCLDGACQHTPIGGDRRVVPR